jgi:hypothetical protein
MLKQLLDLQAIDSQRFTTRNHQESFRKTIFGGQVLAQALMAAGRTVRNRPVHSLHAYFLRAGSVDSPVEYWVENQRDGNSVSSRSVRAVQEGELIFTMQASFHKPEEGFSHQAFTPAEIEPPDIVRQRFNDAEGNNLAREFKHLGVAPIDFVPYSRDLFDPQVSHAQAAQFWVRCNCGVTRIYPMIRWYISVPLLLRRIWAFWPPPFCPIPPVCSMATFTRRAWTTPSGSTANRTSPTGITTRRKVHGPAADAAFVAVRSTISSNA